MEAMSRFLYWTIVLGTEPTSFRASDPGELLPTLAQLREKIRSPEDWTSHQMWEK